MKKYRTAAVEWINTIPIEDAYAVTLTMKHSDRNDRRQCSNNMRHFLNSLNQKIFGNSFRRYNKRVEVVPVLEMSSWQRLHYHMTIVKPHCVDDRVFKSLIEECWLNTSLGNVENDIKPIRNSGWSRYMTKHLGTSSELDIENMHLTR